jgi:hypothetical protein
MDSELFARTMLHPRLKQPMRLVDHLYFVAEHDDHPLAFIWGLLNPEDRAGSANRIGLEGTRISPERTSD